MKFWLVKGVDGKVYLTKKDEEPVRKSDYGTGWNIGWPGTAYIDSDGQMYGLFAIFFEEVRIIINIADFPQSYDDDPVEIEIDLKMHWYGRR